MKTALWMPIFIFATTFFSQFVIVLQSEALSAEPFKPLDLPQVKVGGEIGRRIDVTINNNLLKLNLEQDFLDPFRKQAAHGGYVGLGKTIEASVHFAFYTGDEKLLALKKRLVNETIKTQTPEGYIGIMAEGSRMWSMWDVHEIGYIIQGLVADYHCFHETRSLDAATKLADFVLDRWATMPDDWSQQTHYLTDPVTMGLDSAVLALYAETGQQRFLDFCLKERSLITWNLPIVIGRRELMEGDASAYVSKCLAQLELYHLQPKQELLPQSQRLMQFFRSGDGMCITGAVGLAEVFTDDQDGRGDVGETCETVYQILFFDQLLQLEGKPIYGDFMERTIYNTLFAAQSLDGRRLRYYAPMEGRREYFTADTYCCPCNYRRLISKLPAMIYYQSDQGVAVNLYTSSEADFKLDGGASVKIQQKTDYPTSGHVECQIDPSKPVQFAFQLRIPRWCDKDVTVSVNGQPLKEQVVPGTFFTIDRTWQPGDRVTLDMPMSWRLVLGRKRQSGRAAVMRGPIVFCLNPSQDASIAGKDGADLGYIVLDPTSIADVAGGSDAARPQGVACQLQAGRGGTGIQFCSGLSLQLTEFTDPDGKCVYFRLPDLRAAIPDELIEIPSESR